MAVLVLAFTVTACSSGAKVSTSAARVTTTTEANSTPTVAATTTTTTAPTGEAQPAAVEVAPASTPPPATNKGIDAEPRLDLTPGATDPRVTQANIDSTICVSGYTTTVRPPTSYTDRVKIERLVAYGYSQGKASFELDHLVPLELGGAPYAVANLWPQPWEKSGLVGLGWGAETKDDFENYLHRAVCAKRTTLADAQRHMAVHWIAAAQTVGIAAGSQGAPTPAPSPPPTAEPRPSPTPAPAPAAGSDPSSATAQCQDGSYSYSAHRSGTCSHHGGVARWINQPAS
jgi:hypothetical protein